MSVKAAAPHGIDVSSHQGNVNWAAVAADGNVFAATKATGGAWYTNPTFEANWHGIKAAGMSRLAYHYAFESSGQPYPGPGPEAEADYFLARVEPLGITEGDMLVLDIEEGPGDVDLGDWTLRWLKRVWDRAGFRPLVYTGAWFCEPNGFGNHPELAEYGLWLAAYTTFMPSPPRPWDLIAFWQYGDDGQIDGVAGPCDVNIFNGELSDMPAYGKPSGEQPATAYAYNWQLPTILQEESYDCSQTSLLWDLNAWGLDVNESVMEATMIVEGVMTPAKGCTDATGQGLCDFVERHWGDKGFVASNRVGVSFDEVAGEAGARKYPTCMGGGAWYHWTAVRDYDPSTDMLILANPAPGWGGVYQSLTRAQFAQLGPFNMVRVDCTAVAPPDQGGDDYAPWRPTVGSGLLTMMQEDGDLPAQRQSTWLPLGVSPADVETCYGQSGTLYYWILTTSAGYRVRPS